jgi:hypothetical protein
MPYCITLRSRTDAKITGWYAGKNCVWSLIVRGKNGSPTPRMPVPVCNELRSRCPRAKSCAFGLGAETHSVNCDEIHCLGLSNVAGL